MFWVYAIQVHRILVDIVSASANATPGLGKYPPLKREVQNSAYLFTFLHSLLITGPEFMFINKWFITCRLWSFIQMVAIASSALDDYRSESKKMVVALVDMERAFIPPQHFIRLVQRR